jgi:hypothetical protein
MWLMPLTTAVKASAVCVDRTVFHTIHARP